MKSNLHYHTDCAFFAGCENMLPLFINSKILNEKFNITFSYRYSKRYELDLINKINLTNKIFALNLPEIFDFNLTPNYLSKFLRRVYFFSTRIFLYIPLFIFEIIFFYFFLKRKNIDILHINNGGYPGAFSCRTIAISAKLANINMIIMVVNNMTIEYKSFFRFLDYYPDKLVAMSVNKFITGSKTASISIKNILKLSDNKILNIYNGIKCKEISKTKNELLTLLNLNSYEGIIFGVVGLLIPRKGHFVLLNAIKQLVEENPFLIKKYPFKFLIMGEGHLMPDLYNFVVENELLSYFIFLGHKNDIQNYINIINVLVFPSIENEDFPFAIIEAMSLSKPIIATRVAGTVEQVFNNKNGLLINPNSINELKNALIYILENQQLLEDMGKNSYEYFNSNFDFDIALNKYLKIYKN